MADYRFHLDRVLTKKTQVVIPNNVINLNGSTSFISLDNNVSVRNRNTITLEMWFKQENGSGIRRVYDESINTNSTLNRFALLTSVSGNRRLLFQGRGNDTDSNTVWCSSSTALANNQWYHVAAVYDAPNQIARLYLNGELNVNNVNLANKTFTNINPREFPVIGNSSSSEIIQHFQGELAEVRLWGVARTQHEIQDNMNRRIESNAMGLIECWRLNEGTGIIAKGLKKLTDGDIVDGSWTLSSQDLPINN